MDARRPLRAVPDPKIRHVGFFTPPVVPERTQSCPPDTSTSSPPGSGNSLAPVMIIPPPLRHTSSDAVAVPAGRRTADSLLVGSFEESCSILKDEGDELSEEDSFKWFRRGTNSPSIADSNGIKFSDVSENPKEIGELAGKDQLSSMSTKTLKETTTKAERRALQESQRAAKAAVKGKVGSVVPEVQTESLTSSKPLKEKTTKAERRAMQESQRAAKAAGKDDGNKSANLSGKLPASKTSKQVSQKKEGIPPAVSSVASLDKKGGDRPADKDRKKDLPPPRMQFDDKSRVDKAKRHSVVRQTEAKNRVELFRHLPQYEHGSQLSDLESRFFQLDSIHPSVYKVGLQYLTGDICGGNARCIAMLQAFKEAIRDYSTPPEKAFSRDLTSKISSFVSFLTECRPLSISMGNAIRFLKTRIANLSASISESEAKAALCLDIDRFMNEKIVLADKAIVKHAVTKVRDGDVLLIYGSSSVVEMILLHAHELGRQFRVVVVDSRPKFEGQMLLRRLVAKGLSCTYTHINAVSYIMHEVTRVFLGASSILCNGTVYSRVGTACIAMVANAFRVPVLVCCEAYKFHERVQLDSICSNELGDPNAISKVPWRMDVNYLESLADKGNLQLLNLMYDATPSDYVSLIITDYGMVPPTSIPVIVREYRKDQLWM